MAFGIALAIRADIGVAPGSVIAYSASLLTPLSVGICSSLFHVLCMLLQAAITRSFSPKLLLQLPLAYAFGFMLDAFLWMLDFDLPSMPARYLILAAGLFTFSLGIRAVVGADIILAPPDGLAKALGDLMKQPISRGKLLFDVLVTAIGMLLTLIFAGSAFLAVGWGTVICAIGTGPIIGLYTKLFPMLDIK